MNNLSQELYESLRLKYNTEIQEYKTTLIIFFENSIGIGDHANHIDEMNIIDTLNSIQKEDGAYHHNLMVDIIQQNLQEINL